MKEALSDLRATVRRLSPHLLVQPFPKSMPYPPLTTKKSTSVTENGKETISSPGKASNNLSVQDELQIEATKELVNAISSVIWCLDLLWDGCSSAAEEGEEKKTSNDAVYTHDKKVRSNREPYTEWNEEAKSLIRDGYGLLFTISSPSFVRKDCHVYNYDYQYLQRQNRQQQESLRFIVRTSILELLPSVNTSACRHLLLEFLPHFIPLSILEEKGRVMHDEDQFWSPPLWLERHDNIHVCSAAESLVVGTDDSKYTTFVENAMEQFLETFQSLIQIDPSTLASFLATMSLLFESLPASTERNILLEEVDTSDSLESEIPITGVRKKCCHLCISSLTSVSEHDLPSIIHSLFTLVCDEENGRLAVQAIRKEWISINDSQPKEDLNLFIGHVIILFLLSDEVLGSKHVAMGFLDEVTESLRAHLASCSETKNEAGTCHERSASSCFFSTLDALVVTALYSQPRYQQTIESIIDSLISRQSFIVFDLIFPLIRMWQSGNRNDRSSIKSSKMNHANLLFYDPLASPLISLLFYLIIATSSSEMSCGYLDFVRIGGVLPFLGAETASSAANNKNQALSFDCCKAFAELYCVVDCQRREQIINSLFSMISDSFVQSAPTSDATNMPQRTAAVPSLIATAYSSCCTLLLLSDSHLADIAKTRGASLDRLLLLASLTPSTTSISEEKDHVTYILFDMNCVLLMAFMQQNSDCDATDRSGVSELVIICQKLLFSSSTTLADDNDNQHRVACGIILASRLLRCHNISRSERKDVWNSVVKILSPPTPSSTAPSRKLKPEIGIWGVAFLRFASSNLLSVTDSKPSDCAPRVPRFVETGSVCCEKDMFSLVNNMLAAAGVIQMENSLKVSPQSSSGKSITFLAYSDVPMHYSKETPAPRFVVCAPYFLSGMFRNEEQSQSLLADDKKQMSVSVHFTANYLYDLVDCYLQIGKCRKQGWNPIGWLLAKIQLPCCLPESIMDLLHMKKYHQLEIESSTASFCALNFTLGACESPWKRIAAEIFNKKKSRAAIVQSLVEFMNCLIISISVSCAVLKHANEHFQRQSTLVSFTMNCNTQRLANPSMSDCNDESQQKKKKKRLGALQKLLQFQFAKIQHMQSICEGILFALKSIHTEVCRISHAQASTHKSPDKLKSSRLSQERKLTHEFKTQFIDSHELNTPLLRISLSKLKYTVAALESSIKYRVNDTSFSTLWNCLLDDADDKFLFENIRLSAIPITVSTKTSSVSSYEKVHHIIRLRADTLRQLQHHFIMINANAVHSLSQERCHLLFEESLRGIPRVFSSMITLSSVIQNFRKSTYMKRDSDLDRQRILAFICFHNNVLLAAFSSHTQDLPVRLSVLNDYMGVPKQRRKLLIQPHTNNCSVYLSSLLRACAATVSKDDDCASAPIGNVTKILKEQLIQQFQRCEDSATSCQIIDLISVFIIHIDIDEASTVLADLSQRALNSVYSTNAVKVGLPNAFFKIWHSLKAEKRDAESDYVVIIQDSFSRLFQTANNLQKRTDPSTCAFMHNILTHWSALVLCGASHHNFFSELCESVDEVIANSCTQEPRRFHRSSKKVKLSGLNEKNCVAVFELLIQMVVTSLSLSRPSRVCRDRDCTTIQSENGPYHKVVKAFLAFDRMLRLFQGYHKFFPQRIFISVTRATPHVIKLGIHLFQVCVEWRNSQSLSLQNIHGEDHAGVCFLQPLIAVIACNCIGRIEAFCDSLKRSTAASNMSDARSGLSCKHSRAIAGLLFKCDRAREILQNISRTQNLMLPSQVFINSQNEMLHEKTVQHEVTGSENHRQSKRTADFPNRSSKRQHYDAKLHPSTFLDQIGTAFNTCSDSSPDNIIGDLDHNPDTGFHDEGSFGAVGDWG